MKIVLTGAAGFIGSHLVERLVQLGHQVVGIDRGTTLHLTQVLSHPRFTFVQGDLLTLELTEILAGSEVIFHLAALAGVRQSWNVFPRYVQDNILATHRLLEACRAIPLRKFIYASSSSVYGGSTGPTAENAPLRPLSPYGMSKLAGEQLVHMYHVHYDLPTISLRYFTVYGPRQRPDMAFHRFLKAILHGQPVTVYGDGWQTRDFTFINDAVEANVRAMDLQAHGLALNIGGCQRAAINDVLALMRRVTGREVQVNYRPLQKGDPLHTWADIQQAERLLGYVPQTDLETGLEREWAYIQEVYGQAPCN